MIASAEAATNVAWVGAVGTTRRLQALTAIGYSQAYLCERLRVPPKSASRLFCGGRTLVQAATARKVVSLFAELQSVPGPDDRARRRAARRGWQPPQSWDTDSIDNPAASPNSRWQQPSGAVEVSPKATPALPKIGIANEKWRNDALCPQTDPESFFPEPRDCARDAKRVCVQCPVRMPCLEWALDHDENFGIWGGLSERQRRRLQNKVYNLDGGERRRLLAEHMWPTTHAADQDHGAQPPATAPIRRAV